MRGYLWAGKSESVDAQTRQLTKGRIKQVFGRLHVSGANTGRAQLSGVIEALEPGDVLIVSRLDRLAGKSTRPPVCHRPGGRRLAREKGKAFSQHAV